MAARVHDLSSGRRFDRRAVPLGLDDAALQAVAIGLERQLGRKWVYCQQSGGQGFLSSAVTAPVAAG